MGDCAVAKFADGEVSVSINESVRGSDVFIVQSTCKPVNDNLMELLVMIDACRRASAGRITAVMPYFGYARQDRKAKGRDPISAKLVANMIDSRRRRPRADHGPARRTDSGLLRHPCGQPARQRPCSPGTSWTSSAGQSREHGRSFPPTSAPSPAARSFANKMGMGLAIVDKRRERANQCEVMNVIGDVAGKRCLLYDDMVDTAGSLCNAAKAIVEIAARPRSMPAPTHGILSGPAHRAH